MANVTCIYSFTSPSGSIYIGKTVNLYRRLSVYKGLHCKSQPKLHRSFLKYGYENHQFKILQELPNDVDQSILSTYEILYISQFKECGFKLLNLTDGGEGVSGRVVSEETKEKMRTIFKGRQFPAYARVKALAFHTGRKCSEETRRKMSEASKGKKKSPEHAAKYRNRTGEKRTPQCRKNMSIAQLVRNRLVRGGVDINNYSK